MSASSTWWCVLPSSRRVSSAIVWLRLGRYPYEHGRKSASKIGSSTSFAAICTTRSRTVGDAQWPPLSISLRNVPARDRARPVLACTQHDGDLFQETIDAVPLH